MTQKLTRLDRIEKSVEALVQSIAELRDSQRESHRKIDEAFEKTEEQFRRTEEQFRKTDEQFRRTDRKLEEIGRQLADLGEVAEDLFYRNIPYLFKDGVKGIQRNLKKKGVAEYDIVAETKDGVLVIEVRNKLEKRMVDEFINKRIPKFKTAFPEYRDFRLIGGVGALVVKDDVGRYAEKAGLYVLTQNDKGGAALLNRKGFKAREF